MGHVWDVHIEIFHERMPLQNNQHFISYIFVAFFKKELQAGRKQE